MGNPDGRDIPGRVSTIFENNMISVLIVYDEKGRLKQIFTQ